MSDESGTGDDWLAELYGAHSAAVLAYARRRLASPEDAQDVVVEVFATAWRKRAQVPAQALPWLYAVAANVVAHVVRGEARRARLGARLAAVPSLRVAEDPAELVASAAAAEAGREVVTAALGMLRDEDAELLRLWAWEQLEPSEIARVLGCTPGTARTRLHRARARIREYLSEMGVSSVDGGSLPTSQQEESR